MVDIAMCSWKECPIGKNCYRFLATHDEILQPYCDFSLEYNKRTKRCKFQIPLDRKGREPHGN